MKVTIMDDLHGTRFEQYALSVEIPEDFKPNPSFEQILKTIWIDMVQKRGARHKCDPNARVVIYREGSEGDAQPMTIDSPEHIVFDNFQDALHRLQMLENWNVPYAVGMRFISDFAHDYPIDIDQCRKVLMEHPVGYVRASSKPFSLFSDGTNDGCYTDAIAKIRKTGMDINFILHEDFVETLLHVYDPDSTGHVSRSSVMIYTSCFMEMAALLDETNEIDNTMASQLWVSVRAFIKYGVESPDPMASYRLQKRASEGAKSVRDFNRFEKRCAK